MRVRPHNARLSVRVSTNVQQINANDNNAKQTGNRSAQRMSNDSVKQMNDNSVKRSFKPSSGFRGPRRDNSIIGKTVRILQGPMKNYFGTAKDATDSTVRVELHAQPRIISVDRSRIGIVDGNAISRMLSTGQPFVSGNTTAHDTITQTPMYGAGAQTPLYESLMVISIFYLKY